MIAAHGQRATDAAIFNKPPMRLLRILYVIAIIGGMTLTAICLNAYTTARSHEQAIERAQEISAYNTLALAQVCGLHIARDAKFQQTMADETALYVAYKSQLPAGFASAMATLLSKREAQLTAIDAKGCGLSP